MEDSLRKTCNVVQSVDLLRLHCKGSNLTTNIINILSMLTSVNMYPTITVCQMKTTTNGS